jgi:hypothetical protein
MTTAVLAVVISTVSLVVSIIVGGWQVVRYLLEGGRIGVEIRRGGLTESSLSEAPVYKATPAAELQIAEAGDHAEVIVMRVFNRGRTAVTISEPSVDLSRERSGWRRYAVWRHWWWYRHTVGPYLYRFNDIRDARTVRLEPFDEAQFLMDAQSALNEASKRDRPTRVRGSIRVAGKRARRRSSRRKPLVLMPAQRSLSNTPLTARQVAYQVAARMQPHEGGISPSLAAMLVGKAQSEARALSWESLRDVLKDADYDDAGHHLTLAFQIEEALKWHGLPLIRR